MVGTASARATPLYRFLVGVVGILARWVFAIHVEVRGQENLPRDPTGRPAGGWIASPIPHVSWSDPFVLALAMPPEPRLIFLAAGDAVFRTAFRRILFGIVGGVIPVWPRGRGSAFAAHVEAAQAVIRAGAVFAIYPESARYHPPPDEPRTIEPGIGYIALRTGASIVPIILGGTDELHRGRRIVVDVRPAVTAAQLAGLEDDEVPEAGSRAERDAAHRVADALNELTYPLVIAAAAEARAYHASMRRTWPWLTHWLDR